MAFRADGWELGERGGVRDLEGVAGDPELLCDAEGVHGERVHDHRVDASGTHGRREEELAEVLVVASDDLEVAKEHLGAARDGWRVGDPRERVEGDRRRLGGGGGGEGGVVVHCEADERHGDGLALRKEDVGELHHGDEVAHGEAGVQDDGLRRHGSLCFPGSSSGNSPANGLLVANGHDKKKWINDICRTQTMTRGVDRSGQLLQILLLPVYCK